MEEKIREYFSVIEDFRCPCDIEHPLTDVLILVMCAALCGIDEPEKIVEYGKNKQEFLTHRFNVRKTPSQSTLSRILAAVDGEAVGRIIVEIMYEMLGAAGEEIAFDGKTIRSTGRSALKETLHIITAYAHQNGVILGQSVVGEKTNEIPVLREMLEIIDVEGKTVTADAIHAQTKTVEKIIEKKGDYCISLKANQETLYEDVRLYLDDILSSKLKSDKEKYHTAQTSEKSRNRYEKRTCYLLNDISWLPQLREWAGLRNVLAIKREVTVNDVKSTETNYYISSLDTTPERFLEIVRNHWKIESLHWQLDVIFNEDDCRVISTNGQKTLNAFRKLALCLHKNFKDKTGSKKSMRKHMFSCLLSDEAFIELFEM